MKRICSEKSETSKKKWRGKLEKKKKFVEPYLDTTDSDEKAVFQQYLISPVSRTIIISYTVSTHIERRCSIKI